ncbi:uncharacterized protein LOC18009814 [Eutrema salsugineum]|uniref:uncharacterized protein LOC18009814 n=1 Tax=Eutrema salsugineum TaxID=72664 RepID=UPI000CED0B2C|nr:uncharacterized protein LOC18009814 [Eutrema salsugineum]
MGRSSCPTNNAKVVVKLFKSIIFPCFGIPQTTSGQVEISNKEIKSILQKTIGVNRKDWSEKLKNALCAYQTAYKTHLETTPFNLVYGKACHIPVELEYKAQWTIKEMNMNFKAAGERRMRQIHELEEIRQNAYEKSTIYKEKTKMDKPPPALKWNSHDVGWEYGVLNDPKNPDKVKCLLCGNEFFGGVHRLKLHIAHKKGVVSSCPVSTKADQEKCPMDRFASNINPEASLATQKRQESINIVQDGCVLREPLLNEDVQRTKEKLKVLEEEWDREGCSVMTDSWTDMKRRSIMNLCVNSRGGTCFLSSKDTSKDSHTGEYIFKYIDGCIEELGATRIVQVVTDNAKNNVAAAKMLKEKRPTIFWSGCAAHTLDLMLEGVSKLQNFDKVISQAKAATIFIYAHHKTLNMMRTYTKKRDIVRPGATRFATCFLTLHSLYEKKAQLKSMFTSDEWHECTHSKALKGKNVFETIMSFGFWNSVMMVLKIFSPLVKVLRLADGEKIPSMGFIYGEILEARKCIKEPCDHVERNYQPVFKIIVDKMKDPTIQFDMVIVEGFMSCVETFYYGNFENQDKIMNHELCLYKNKVGLFGNRLALKGCETRDDKFNLGNWWSTYGCGAPNLQKLATRILASISSSSGEQNADAIFEDGNEDTVEEWIVGPRLEDQDSDVNLVLAAQFP